MKVQGMIEGGLDRGVLSGLLRGYGELRHRPYAYNGVHSSAFKRVRDGFPVGNVW